MTRSLKNPSVILILCITITYGDIQTDLRYIRSCNETSPISLETMNNVLIHKKMDGDGSSSNFKCFLHCLFAKYEWMDEDGGFRVHEIKSVLETVQLEIASFEYVLYKCTAIESVDKCERAALFMQCFWAKAIQKQSHNERFAYRIEDKK